MDAPSIVANAIVGLVIASMVLAIEYFIFKPNGHLAVGFTGAIFSIVPVLSIAVTILSSSFSATLTFGLATLPAIIAGSLLAIFVDTRWLDKARMWVRLLLGAILGLVAGVFECGIFLAFWPLWFKILDALI